MEEKHEDIEEPEPWWKGPIKWIIGLFLVLIIVLWVFPYYSIRLDPEPSGVPKLSDVFEGGVVINKTNDVVSREDFLKLVEPANPIVKGVADRVVSYGCGSEKVCHAKALFYFVRDEFNYVSDPESFEYVKSAVERLSNKGGGCDDASVLLVNLLEAVGIRARFVFVPGHVYVQAYLPEALNRYKDKDGYVSLEPTCSNCDFGEIGFSDFKAEKSYVG